MYKENASATGVIFYSDHFTVYDSDGANNLTNEFFALGSGADFAKGAMAFGASAEEAVKIAMQFDCYTGGEIQILSFD